MNKLWAPWRIRYVQGKKEKGCVFCRIVRSRADKKNYVVSRSQHCFALLNTYPYNNGHVMVVPNKHVASLEKLGDEVMQDMNQLMLSVKARLHKVLKPEGYNIGFNIGEVAGAGVKNHVHMHIVPRWGGDTNFMPVIADTKIISQSLGMLHAQLTRYKEK